MIIDAHAHILSSHPQVLNGVHTYALHPWNIKKSLDLNRFKLELENELKKRMKEQKKLLAIGECGLDRGYEGIALMSLQKEVFEIHLDFAISLNLPIIIHCVRAFSDILEILKRKKPKIPMLFHAFNGNENDIEALLKYNSYFSQGLSLFKNYSKLKIIPLSRLLLESGDQNEKTIGEIYEKAALDLNLNPKILEDQVLKNILEFYNANHIGATDFCKNLDATKIL